MKNYLKSIWLAVLLAVISVPLVWGQHTMNSTTLSSAVAKADRTFSVAAADATAVKVGSVYYVNGESGYITVISGTRLDVVRNNPTRHSSGDTIYIDLPNYFGGDPSGTGVAFANTPCTSTAELVLPRIDLGAKQVTNCTSSVWIPQYVTDQALTSPTITTDIRSVTAGSATLGTAALPFGSAYIGGAATNNFIITGTATAARTFTLPDLASTTFAMIGGTQTLTGKTLTSPTLTTPALGVATGTGLILTGVSANTLTAGRVGATNPAFNVDASAATSATGMEVVSAAAASGVNLRAISSGANENLTINAKGSGTIGIAPTSTGVITITPATTITGALTPTGGVAAAGGFTASCRNFAAGGLVPAVSTDFTDATPVITETYITEVFVPANCTATGIAVFNGSNVTGNMNVGMADSAGAVIAESVDTAGSGADSYQRIAFTATEALVGPATYYILVQYSSAVARYNAPPLGNHGCSAKAGETFGTFTAITPPTNCAANVGNIASLY